MLGLVEIGGKMSKICKNMRKFPKMLVFLDTFFWGYLRKWSKIYEPDTLVRMCENRHSESDV